VIAIRMRPEGHQETFAQLLLNILGYFQEK
jgi:hypothetical protein